MSQLAERFSQPEMGGANCFLRRLEAERLQEYGWQEPYESRGSRTVLRGTGGEIPPVYPTKIRFRILTAQNSQPCSM
jgi:hypothetical protein